jgi:hypothetical protein
MAIVGVVFMRFSIVSRIVFPLLIAVMFVSVLVQPAWCKARRDDPSSIRGAIYVPSDAYNAPQLWKNFSIEETRRDFGYAQTIHINALRIWASYEYWQMEPAKFQISFDQMLGAAHESGIRILISLFENDGVPPTAENMWTTDPAKAFAIQSPGRSIAAGDQSQWEQPRRFVEWFMKRYSNDDRLLAIEVMNEPGDGKKGQQGTVPFAQSMLRTAKSLQGSVPLTIGSAKLRVAKQFIPLGLDIINIHDNFPVNTQALEAEIKEAMEAGQKADIPVWLTEWQRVRAGGSGWGAQGVASAERMTDYASLAPTVYSYPVGNFFWSLMVKRAYLPSQRMYGTVNGLFWPDGSVSSLKDSRAIAQNPKLQFRERPIPADLTKVSK